MHILRFTPPMASNSPGKNAMQAHSLSDRITADPAICGGRPTITGTRMRVADILEMLASGAERAQILSDYDYLTDEDISAALSYAADAIDHQVIRAA